MAADLKVIGAGFGRTGTLSLKKALEDLGFGRVYHGEDIILRPHHYYYWRRVHRTGRGDWDKIFKGFSSALDYPVCSLWQTLAEYYPNAKIILTVRDPERWWASTANTIYPARDVLPAWWKATIPTTRAYHQFTEGLLWDGIFDGRFLDKDHAIGVFNRHIEEVKAKADPDRLLVFRVAEGWEPLCGFLGVPVPDRPFPHVNDTERMKRWLTVTRIGTRVGPPLTAAATAWGIARLLRS